MDFLKKPWVKYGALVVIVGLFIWEVVGKSVMADNAAPDFTLTNQNGQKVNLSDYRGKVVILDFWATWCPPCKAEIPGFVSLYNKYKDNGLVVLGVSLDRDGWSSVRPFIKNYKISYPVMLGTQNVVQAYGNIQSIPTTFVLDKQGKIRQKYVGLTRSAQFENDFRTLINE